MYNDSVIREVINPTEEFENKMLLQLESTPDDPEGMKIFPNPKEQFIGYCINLYLNNKLLDVNKFSTYLKNSEDKNKFLWDMEDFDYSKFKIDWMQGFNENLKIRISENKVAYQNIKTIYKKIFQDGEYDENMLKYYFEYFDK